MFKIGLTGGIGSGKSRVADFFQEWGASIVDTDAIAHELTAPGGRAIPAIRQAFGDVMIAPDGRQFIFLHRYFIGRRKYDRLMLAAADGSGLRVLSANGMVSHCFWINGGALLCYLRGPTGRDGYHIVDTLTGRSESLFAGALDTMGDGHPHIHDDWFVTDTYPDRRRMQHLIKANLRTGKITELGRFVHSFRYGGETRCDLHPRIAPDGRQVFFDSVCSGRRRLYCLETEPREESQK